MQATGWSVGEASSALEPQRMRATGGHGAGVTLAWGCADDVAALVMRSPA
jgi:hypothetical protein